MRLLSLAMAGIVLPTLSLLGCDTPSEPAGPYRIAAYMTGTIKQGDRWVYEVTGNVNSAIASAERDSGQIEIQVAGWSGDSTQLHLDGRATGFNMRHMPEIGLDTLPVDHSFRILVTASRRDGNDVKSKVDPIPDPSNLDFGFSEYISQYLFAGAGFFHPDLKSPLAVALEGQAVPAFEAQERFRERHYLQAPPILVFARNGTYNRLHQEIVTLKLKSLNGKPVQL